MSRFVVAVDPSVLASGVAIFGDGRLIGAFLVSQPKVAGESDIRRWIRMATTIADTTMANMGASSAGVRLVVEVPQVYRHSRTDPNGLLGLAAIAAVVGALLRPQEIIAYLPREWKGQVPKAVHNRRVLSKLTTQELTLVPELPASKLHNVIDGIGLGQYYLSRIPAEVAWAYQ